MEYNLHLQWRAIVVNMATKRLVHEDGGLKARWNALSREFKPVRSQNSARILYVWGILSPSNISCLSEMFLFLLCHCIHPRNNPPPHTLHTSESERLKTSLTLREGEGEQLMVFPPTSPALILLAYDSPTTQIWAPTRRAERWQVASLQCYIIIIWHLVIF